LNLGLLPPAPGTELKDGVVHDFTPVTIGVAYVSADIERDHEEEPAWQLMLVIPGPSHYRTHGPYVAIALDMDYGYRGVRESEGIIWLIVADS
jgi:hypothetical protein